MFTGIIEEVGEVINFEFDKIEIACSKVLEGTKIGDSICTNGVCQTAYSISSKSFCARLSETTRNISTFKNIKKGTKVNLERALTLNSRLGGHIVSGHVEGVGSIENIINKSEFFDVYIKLPNELQKYVVKKGSICIDGISLTVADMSKNTVVLSIIPHTFNNTNLKYLNIGSFVNVETDILSKYVEKFLLTGNNSIDNKIDEHFLIENGFWS